jgi:hypothetical protein
MSYNYGAKNAKDIDTPWTHWFLYGPTGGGKTTAAATFPKPCFLVPQNEQSITTLAGRDVAYFEIVDMDQTRLDLKTGRGSMMHVVDHLIRGYLKDPDNFPFDTLVFESLSHYGDLVQEQLTRGDQKMDQQKWGFFLAHFRTLQARLRALDLHVVFTSLDSLKEEQGGSGYIGGPLIPGQSAIKLPASCDVIGYCEEKGGKHTIHFRTHRNFRARSRFPKLPAKVVNFEFSDVEKYLTL